MSDSRSPNGGPSPYDGSDLEGLLSGKNVRVPEGMRLVAGTLAALRATPMPAELAGEAAARAMFREVMWDRASGPPRSDAEALGARTLMLEAPAADCVPDTASGRHRSHRRPALRGRRRLTALAGVAAAAVVVVGAAALASTLSGFGGHPGEPGRSPGAVGAASRSGGRAAALNALEGIATKVATAPATPSASATQQLSGSSGTKSGPAALCDEYMASLARHGPHADRAAENANFKRLSKLAGGPENIGYYCMEFQPWTVVQGFGAFPGRPMPLPPDSSTSGPSPGGPPSEQKSQGKGRPNRGA